MESKITKVHCSECYTAHALRLSNFDAVNYLFRCINCKETLVVNGDLSTSRLIDRAYQYTRDALNHAHNKGVL